MPVLGVVSARRATKAAAAAAAPGQLAFPGFVYNGGSVIASPAVYTSFWGALWSDAAHQSAAQRLNLYVQDLLASNFMNVLSQYGVGSGAGSGQFAQTSFLPNVANQLTDNDIQNTIQPAINAGQMPEPPANNTSQVLLIFLDEDTEVNDRNLGIVLCEPQGDTAFGYHNNFTTAAGNSFYYGVIPGLDDACLLNSCGNSPCSLNPSLSQEQRRTQVTSHEFAEMLTDPAPPSGWYDQSDPNSGEVGDICNGQSDTIAGASGNSWTVQRIYSAYDDQQTGGANYCLSQSTTPEPLLPGAP
jgi:serine protease